MSIDCNGTQSHRERHRRTPGTVVAVTVEVGPGKVEVKAKSEHVSEPEGEPALAALAALDEPSKPKPS